jgi:predicted RNA-binding Zn-ribbon protein involved in translation (DUF1610 family)
MTRKEAPMPYQHCPSCRLTVHLDAEIVRDGPCPRCGDQLADEPRRLFSTRPAVDPEAVRAMLQRRGGRFTRRVRG